jgi:hypothetical protein
MNILNMSFDTTYLGGVIFCLKLLTTHVFVSSSFIMLMQSTEYVVVKLELSGFDSVIA